jgi:hypothetical protein
MMLTYTGYSSTARIPVAFRAETRYASSQNRDTLSDLAVNDSVDVEITGASPWSAYQVSCERFVP